MDKHLAVMLVATGSKSDIFGFIGLKYALESVPDFCNSFKISSQFDSKLPVMCLIGSQYNILIYSVMGNFLIMHHGSMKYYYCVEHNNIKLVCLQD